MKVLTLPNKPWYVAKPALAAMTAAILSGCASNTVVMTTATRIGLDINASEPGLQGAHFGYDRFEGVIMPIVSTNKQGETIYLGDAYPIYSRHYVHVGSLILDFTTNTNAGVKVVQSLATGKAAKMPAVRTAVSNQFNTLMGRNGVK